MLYKPLRSVGGTQTVFLAIGVKTAVGIFRTKTHQKPGQQQEKVSFNSSLFLEEKDYIALITVINYLQSDQLFIHHILVFPS